MATTMKDDKDLPLAVKAEVRSSPVFSLRTSSLDDDAALARLNEVIERLRTAIEHAGGHCTVKEQPFKVRAPAGGGTGA